MAYLQTMADLLARHAARGALAQLAPAPARRVPTGQGALALSPDQSSPAASDAGRPALHRPALNRPDPQQPAQRGAALPIRRVPRGEAYDLVAGGARAVAVRPAAAGWIVVNVGAGHKRPVLDSHAADVLAARIARLMAAI